MILDNLFFLEPRFPMLHNIETKNKERNLVLMMKHICGILKLDILTLTESKDWLRIDR